MSKGAHWMDRLMHDLRGPLMPLQTAAYLLKHEREQLDAQRQQELVDIIQRQTQRLSRMLEEFGDWSRAQQQRLLRAFSPCELTHLLDKATGAIPGCAIDPQLDVECSGAYVLGDEARLVQALKTLIGYSHARDSAATLRAACAEGELTLQLRDRGPPVDATQADLLLAQPEAVPRDDGLGLGLILARAIIEAHAGSVVAAPMPDGLLITCKLPLAAHTA